MSYPIHPAAAVVPMMSEDDLHALAADIYHNGLQQPIVLFQGQVLDGRNRLKACKLANVKPDFVTLEECPSPAAYVISANVRRRHLTATQRAFAALLHLPALEEEAKDRQREAGGVNPGCGKNSASAKRAPGARERAAEAAGVNAKYISDAKRIKKKDPAIAAACERGEMTMQDAKRRLEIQPDPSKKALDIRDEVRHMSLHGHSQDDIAEALGVSRYAVQKAQESAGITGSKVHSRTHPSVGFLAQVEGIKELCESVLKRGNVFNGLSQEQLSSALGTVSRAKTELYRVHKQIKGKL